MDEMNNAFSQNSINFFDKINSGIMLVNEDRNILYANKYFLNLFETDLDKIKNRKCWSVMHPETPGCRKCETQDNMNMEVDINGNLKNIIFTNSLIADNVLIKVIQDISKILKKLHNIETEVSNLRKLVDSTFGNSDFLTSCSICTKIRLKDGTWVSPSNIENLMSSGYISHGLCPECAKPYIDEIMKK